MTQIGARSYEKKNKQPVLIDATLEVDIQDAVDKDHIDTTIDYSQVAKAIISFLEKSQFELLESLAYHLTKELLKSFPLKSAGVTAHKPHATKGLANISVEYFAKTCQ